MSLRLLSLGGPECHILVRASVSGLPVRCVVDTGASHSCMDIRFVAENFPDATVQSKEAFTAGIGAEGFKVQTADIPDVRIGRFHMPVYPDMALVDFSHINSAYEKMRRRPVRMIIGNDFLRQHGAVIDYPNLRFTFSAGTGHER